MGPRLLDFSSYVTDLLTRAIASEVLKRPFEHKNSRFGPNSDFEAPSIRHC
jgi:hypothetical protein